MPRGFLSRASRARVLAARHAEARQALLFYAEVAAFQRGVNPREPLSSLPELTTLVIARGPEPLRAAARVITAERCAAALEEPSSLESFFARVLFQASSDPPRGNGACLRCGHAPQAAALRVRGDGTELSFVCSLCFHEWPAARDRCSECGGEVVFHETTELPQIRMRACEKCRRYLHVVRLDADPDAIPEVDEMAALSLDVWGRGQGFEKIYPNLAGI
jgi:formate dehydrogenase maturation protein FdhE